MFRFLGTASIVLALSASQAHAVTIEMVTVGNADNGVDSTDYGKVVYAYNIGKYEVTNAQYVAFLNAVDAAGTNPNGVYNADMGIDPRGGITLNSGAANGSKYSTKDNMANKPVNYVSILDAMRFVNWLENGQPSNGGGTESGTYEINGINDGLSETRNPDASFFLPSEDEWYKAAYHQPAAQGGDPDDYWQYPIPGNNNAPTLASANSAGDIGNPGSRVANYNYGADWNSLNGNVTTVGSAGSLSGSYYGTFDQAGNVWEWNEALIDATKRGIRGGSWNNASSNLAATSRNAVIPTNEGAGVGFRVAGAYVEVIVPEPSTIVMLLSGMAGGWAWLRRRSGT